MVHCKTTGMVMPITVTEGDVYNRWTALKFSHKSESGNIFWIFMCECGNEKPVSVSRVTKSKSKSCGCLRKKADFNITHGLRKSPLYSRWISMKQRCNNKKSPNYENYGGRGISICKSWVESFSNFYSDMINGYIDGYHLDRIDVNGNYEPSNCRWVTNTQNQNNKRNNVYICLDGRTHTPAEWSRETGVKDSTISNRKRKGWSDYDAIFGLNTAKLGL